MEQHLLIEHPLVRDLEHEALNYVTHYAGGGYYDDIRQHLYLACQSFNNHGSVVFETEGTTLSKFDLAYIDKITLILSELKSMLVDMTQSSNRRFKGFHYPGVGRGKIIVIVE